MDYNAENNLSLLYNRGFNARLMSVELLVDDWGRMINLWLIFVFVLKEAANLSSDI
jgi:hypothetical protein